MNLESTQSLEIRGDQQLGLLWNLSHRKEALMALDDHLARIDHVPRIEGEHPVAMISERELETLSYPIDGQMESALERINDAILCKSNIIGHVFVPREESEITAGFAGAKGNLVWINTGDSALSLSMKTGKDTKSVLIDPGLGFCLGKRQRHTRVFITAITRAADMFSNNTVMNAPRAHATFFGCDMGDKNC